MSGDHVTCFSCGTGYYSGVSPNCPNCGTNRYIYIIYGIILFLTLIAGLAFGAIALTYFARKKSWHWVSYIGSLIVAGFSIYYVAENWDMEWYTVAIIFLNLFGILYALFNLFRKWFKWIVVGSILLGVIIAYWPKKDDISTENSELYPEEEELIEIKEADESDNYSIETEILDEKEVDTENASETVLESEKLIIYKNAYYRIEDPDGWTNLRDTINGNIIRKIYPNEKFIVVTEENDWCKVFFEDFTSGFIHKSRIKESKD